MEIKEMTIDELMERKSAIVAEIDNPEADLDALEAEARSIKEEIEARQNAETKKAEIRASVAAGSGQVVEKIDTEVRTTMFDVDSVEYRNAWLKNLQGKELTVEERAGYTQSSTYATNAIPTIIATKMFEKMKKLAPMLSEITLMQVAGNLKFVSEGTRNAADSKHTENSALTPATDTTISVTLGAYEFVKIIGISKSASMMSVDAFEEWLVDMLAGDIARAIDNYILNDASHGIAANTYTSNTNQLVVTNGYGYTDICNLISLLPAAYDAEAKFVVNKKTLYGVIAQIVDSAGNPIFVQNPEDGMKGRIMGYPVLVDDYVTTANKAVYLGAYKNVVGNLSEGIGVDRSSEAGFTSASILYRGYASFDSQTAVPEAIVRLVSTV